MTTTNNYRDNLREAADEELAAGEKDAARSTPERRTASGKGRIFAAAEAAAAHDLEREVCRHRRHNTGELAFFY